MEQRKTQEMTLANKTTEQQLLDYYLIPELLQDLPRGYAKRVKCKLLSHNVNIHSTSTIYQSAKMILDGKNTLRPAADVNGRPSTREGKDKAYEGFWSLMDVFLPNPSKRNYIGLAANQVGVVRDRVGGWNPVVVCEYNQVRENKLRELAGFVMRSRLGPHISVVGRNIFDHLGRGENCNSFNIFDLDLMCVIPGLTELDDWARVIYRSAKSGTNLIYIAVCIGRSITEEEHSFRMEYFEQSLTCRNFKLVGSSPFAYRDRKIPMRVNRIVLEK